MPTEEEIREQYDDLDELPGGAAKRAALEQVIAHADAAELTDLGVEARIDLISELRDAHDLGRAMSTFSWCLRTWDQHPDSVDPYADEMLLWQYKWIVSAMADFPGIRRDQIHGAFGDMEARYLRGGHSLHAVHARRHENAVVMGELDVATEELRLWRAAARDENSDCATCDPELLVEWHSTNRDWAAAVEVGDPVAAQGRTCDSQPESILTTLLLPYAHTGRHEEAWQAHLRSYRKYRVHEDEIRRVAMHLRYCALTGREARGLEILERHLPWLDRAPVPANRLRFAEAGALLTRRLIDLGQGAVTVVGGGTVADLHEHLLGTASDLAAQFDARNGNDSCSRQLHDTVHEAPIVAAAASLEPPVVEGAVLDVGELAGAFRTAMGCGDAPGALDAARALRLIGVDVPPEPAGDVLDARGYVLLVDDEDHDAAAVAYRAAVEAHRARGDELAAVQAVRRVAVIGLTELDADDPGSAAVLLEADRVVAMLQDLGASPFELADACAALGLALAQAEQLDRARAVLDQGRRVAADGTLGQVRLDLAEVVLTRCRGAQPDPQTVRALVAGARQVGHPVDVCAAARLAAETLAAEGEFAEALPYAELAATSAARLGTPLRARIELLRAWLLQDLDRAHEAVEPLRTALALTLVRGQRYDVALATFRLAQLLLNLDRSLEAAELLEGIRADVDELGIDAMSIDHRDMLARGLFDIGEMEAAAEHAEHAGDLMALAGDIRAAGPYRLAGDAHRARGGQDEAARLYGQGVQLSRTDAPLFASFLLRAQARMTAGEDYDRAEALFAEAEQILAELPPDPDVDLDWQRADLADDRALTLWDLDRNGEAHDFAARAEEGFFGCGDIGNAARLALFRARLHLEYDEMQQARPHATRALSLLGDADVDVEHPMAREAREMLEYIDAPT